MNNSLRHLTPFMKNKILLLACIFIFGCYSPSSTKSNDVECQAPIHEEIKVYFSPNGGATKAIVDEIDNAKENIYVQAYSFTSEPISQALISAHKRKVKISVILDKSDLTAKNSQYTNLINDNIDVLIDDKHAIAHNKVIIIDHKIVLTGSFNFTTAAEKNNAENSLHIVSTKLAEQYIENWNIHKEHSVLN